MRTNWNPKLRPAGAVAALGLFLLLLGNAGTARLAVASPAPQCALSGQAKKPAQKSSRHQKTTRKARTAGKYRPKAAKSAAPVGPPPRTTFTAAEQSAAIIPHIPDARFYADSEVAYLRTLPTAPGPWLILSAGGEDGAFGAGLLNGWTATGHRPEFALVTGVSTGAMIAPYAFLGPAYDAALRDAYTTLNAADIFEVGGKGESMADTWPLRELLAKRITPDLLKAIAAEHARGRRLFILTTNIDAGRPVAWDIGAIASRADDQALELVRKIILASISIPGAFPPVMIEAAADGRRFSELHIDGGLAGQFYLAPDSLLASTSKTRLPATDIYIVANMKLTPEFALAERSLSGILGRTVSIATKYAIRGGIEQAFAAAKRDGIGFHLAYIDQAFDAPSRGAFDTDYMKALYEAGVRKGRSAEPFAHEPVDFSDQPKKTAR